MNHIVTQRFIECFEQLKQLNTVRSSRQFAMSLDYLPQSFSEVLNGNRNVTIDLLQKAVEVYNFNPIFVCKGVGPHFCNDANHDSSRVLTVIIDSDNNERIMHVPVKAQAGYAGETLDPVLVEELPTYTLPDYAFKVGTHRSFDVAGDSMEPSLNDGDKIICSYIEHNHWESGIKDHNVYVIVTQGDVLVKRVVNNLRKHRHLELHSDNDYYPQIRVNVNTIREVWHVRARLSRFCHQLPANPVRDDNNNTEHTSELMKTINEQNEMIRKLNSTIEKIVLRKEI